MELIVKPNIRLNICPDIEPDKASCISPYLANETVVIPSCSEFPMAKIVLPKKVLPRPRTKPTDWRVSKRIIVRILDHNIP